MADDPHLREMTCDPKFRRVLITDGRTPVGQAMATALFRCRRVDRVRRTCRCLEAVFRAGQPAQDRTRRDRAARRDRYESVTEQAEQNGARIDIVVNTAEHVRAGGVVDRHGLTIAREEIDVRYLGLMRLAQAFGPILRFRGADGVNSAAAFVNLLSVHALMNWPAYGSYSRDRGGMSVGGAMHARGIAPRRRQGVECVLRPARDRMVPDRAAAEGRRRRRSPMRWSAPSARASRTCLWATSPRTSGNALRSTRRRSSAKWRAEGHVRARLISVLRARGRQWRHPRDRPDADAVAGISDHRAAARIRAMRAVPDRGGVALRRARTGLVLEQHQSRRAYRDAFRRADPLDFRQGFAEQRGRYHRRRANSSRPPA